MTPRPDPVAFVEACYQLECSDKEWLTALVQRFHDLLPDHNGVVAYQYEDLGAGVRISNVVQSRPHLNVAERLNEVGAAIARPTEELDEVTAALQRVFRYGMREPAERLLMSEFTRHGPDWMYALGIPGVVDQLALASRHIDAPDATILVCGLTRPLQLRTPQRERFHMLSAHLKAGLRLRRRVGAAPTSVDTPDGGAVLDGAGRLLDAEGEAASSASRAALSEAARWIEHARTRRSDDEALTVWRGLVAGTWSLVDHIDADGKRFMLAHRNAEGVLDPRRLGERERRVLALAGCGYSNKLVAYHLGLPESTVATHLQAAMRKLALSSRVQVVRLFAEAAAPHDNATGP